ncbi:type II toxin-antitoxin system VapC family toxin [Candidatus Palauibacter sp.]|uniref:type II toxin-antitoxin system VapC family toxin n=1 Tax=Candidatus Palauibacter sp. TaxID=3101350 RepID=UPI003B01837D
MIVDTSAILAILFREEDARRFERALASASAPQISAATLVEAAMVAEARGGLGAGQDLDDLLERVPIQVIPVTRQHAEAARNAWRCYGKGNHPAALNLGDCFVYALARTAGEPLLFKGKDFALTDIEVA